MRNSFRGHSLVVRYLLNVAMRSRLSLVNSPAPLAGPHGPGWLRHVGQILMVLTALTVGLAWVMGGLRSGRQRGYPLQSVIPGAAGLAAQWSLLWLGLLVSRLTYLWKFYDYRRFIELHKRLGLAAVLFAMVHVIALALLADDDRLRLILERPSYFLAATSLLLLLVTSATVLPRIRAFLADRRYERWRWIHGLVLVSLLTTVWHESRSPSIGWKTGAGLLWLAAHICVVWCYILSRWFLPWLRNRRHDFRILERPTPVEISDATGRRAVSHYSIRVGGKDLDKIAPQDVTGLGFANVRFSFVRHAAGEERSYSAGNEHSYSVTRRTTVTGPFLELLVDAGDRDLNKVKDLEPRDRVLIDALHGQMTAAFCRRGKAAIFANGMAIETVYPLIEDLVATLAQAKSSATRKVVTEVPEVVAVLRVSNWNSVSAGTRDALVRLQNTGSLLILLIHGAQLDQPGKAWLGQPRDGTQPPEGIRVHEAEPSRSSLDELATLICDLDERDIFLEGSHGWCETVFSLLRRLGRSSRDLHREYPSWDPPRHDPAASATLPVQPPQEHHKLPVDVQDRARQECASPNSTRVGLRASADRVIWAREKHVGEQTGRYGKWSRVGGLRRKLVEIAVTLGGILTTISFGQAAVRYVIDWVPDPPVDAQEILVDEFFINTSLNGLTGDSEKYRVVSPIYVSGRTFLETDEHLWLLLKPPKDPKAIPLADRKGLYVVTHKSPVTSGNEGGEWRRKVDLGNGPCDKGKDYQLFVFRTKTPDPIEAKQAKEKEDYPTFRKIPPSAKVVGAADVKLVEYDGEHTRCPPSPAPNL